MDLAKCLHKVPQWVREIINDWLQEHGLEERDVIDDYNLRSSPQEREIFRDECEYVKKNLTTNVSGHITLIGRATSKASSETE